MGIYESDGSSLSHLQRGGDTLLVRNASLYNHPYVSITGVTIGASKMFKGAEIASLT